MRLVVSDDTGLADTTTMTTVTNVAPVIAAFPGAALIVGETYAASEQFADLGDGAWTGTVSWDDGAEGALALTGQTFTLSHDHDAAAPTG